jgi:tetratricopeptide (TPR) repeat protein
MEPFKAMEDKAMEAIHLMSTSKDVHVIRELALLARTQFEQVLTASNNHAASPNLIFHLGLACSMLKDWKATEECMFTVLQHDPGLVPAKRYLADAFHAQHKYMEAVHYYDEFFNDFPKYYGRAIRDDGTIPDLVGNATTVDSESILADVVFSRGKSYFAMKEYGSDFAKEDFKAVVRMNAKHKAHSLLFLGMLEFRGKDYWKAIKYFDLALQTGPAHWAMYKERADAWRALGKEERALDDERHADLLKRQLHWSNQIESKQEHDVIPEFKIDRYLEGAAITQPDGKSMR